MYTLSVLVALRTHRNLELESRGWLHQTLFILYNHNSSCITIIALASESSRSHFGKVIKDVLDYAISNTGVGSLSVKILDNIKMPNAVTKAIEDYCQCALNKGHFYHIPLVAKSKDSILFLEKYFNSLR